MFGIWSVCVLTVELDDTGSEDLRIVIDVMLNNISKYIESTNMYIIVLLEYIELSTIVLDVIAWIHEYNSMFSQDVTGTLIATDTCHEILRDFQVKIHG